MKTNHTVISTPDLGLIFSTLYGFVNLAPDNFDNPKQAFTILKDQICEFLKRVYCYPTFLVRYASVLNLKLDSFGFDSRTTYNINLSYNVKSRNFVLKVTRHLDTYVPKPAQPSK